MYQHIRGTAIVNRDMITNIRMTIVHTAIVTTAKRVHTTLTGSGLALQGLSKQPTCGPTRQFRV